MARPLRVEYPGAFHHVTTRGVARGEIFFRDADRLAFLSRLAEAQERWGIVFHGYCLMTNHYHLEVESPAGPLSQPIRWINQTHATYINRTYGREGTLFQGRFKSAVVEAETHLHELTRYLHLNPVRAGMVKHPRDYRWSSYRDFLGLRRPPAWLEVKETLQRFGRRESTQRKRYREFVEKPGQVVQDPLRELAFGIALGTPKFVAWVRETFCDRKADRDVAKLEQARPRPTLKTICELVAARRDLPEASLRLRGKHHNLGRDMAVYLARQHSGRPLTEIGAYFGGIAPSTVSMACHRVEERISTSRAFRRQVKKLADELGTATE